MKLVKSLFSLRQKSHLNTRLEIRDERAYRNRLLMWLAPVNISFAFVDWLSVAGAPLLKFVFMRTLGVVVSALFWYLLRGRVNYKIRFFCLLLPYMFVVEYIMISNGLVISPYYAGVSLVMITATMLFPVRSKVASVVYSVSVLPIVVWSIFLSGYSAVTLVQLNLMVLGSVLICAVNSGQIWIEFRERLKASEALARDKGKRGRVIDEKAKELLSRKIFESQFSPQVVTAVLKNKLLPKSMIKTKIVNIVIDIQDSTKKANSISADDYKNVIEEVLDVFSASCLKWNVTLDKFTGDGVQAFAGAPIPSHDDFSRALMTCRDTIAMLQARKSALNNLWKDVLNVRFAICEGNALVGFVGKGIFKSYTAIGDMVSFTHRLSSIPSPWSIAAYSWDASYKKEIFAPGFNVKYQNVSDLKGFGSQTFQVAVISSKEDEPIQLDAGRCSHCATPLVLEDLPGGLPNIYCPACDSKMNKAA